MTEDEIDQKILKLRALRDALFDELDRMRTGKTNATDAKRLANAKGTLKRAELHGASWPRDETGG